MSKELKCEYPVSHECGEPYGTKITRLYKHRWYTIAFGSKLSALKCIITAPWRVRVSFRGGLHIGQYTKTERVCLNAHLGSTHGLYAVKVKKPLGYANETTQSGYIVDDVERFFYVPDRHYFGDHAPVDVLFSDKPQWLMESEEADIKT